MKRLTLVLALLALSAFGLAACGGDDEESAATETTATTETTDSGGGGGGGGGGTVAISADPDGALAFATDSATAPAGEVTVEFDNPASIGHDVVVEDGDGNELLRTDVITGETTTASAELEPGDYTFFCSVAGHRESGMEGTLTVE